MPRSLGDPGRPSATSEKHEPSSPNHLECKIADSLWCRQCRSVGIGHRGWCAISEEPVSIRSKGEELVEVHNAEASQRIKWAVELAASTNPRVDFDGRREPGINSEV